jgi:hypothetical protein
LATRRRRSRWLHMCTCRSLRWQTQRAGWPASSPIRNSRTATDC